MMKKILIPIVSLLLVLSLAVAVNAAAVATTWNELFAIDVDAAGNSEGTVSVDANGAIVLDASAGLWWPQVGVTFKEKVDINGLELIVNCPAFSDPSANGYFMASFSSVAATDFGLTLLGGRAYCPELAADKTLALCIMGGISFGVEGVYTDQGENFAGLLPYTSGTDVRITFVVDGENIKIKVDDAFLQSQGADLVAPLSAVADADGKAYLNLSAVGYGGSGADGITIKYINGVAANDFAGAAGTYTGEIGTSSEAPASSEAASSEVPASSITVVESTPAASTGCGNKA